MKTFLISLIAIAGLALPLTAQDGAQWDPVFNKGFTYRNLGPFRISAWVSDIAVPDTPGKAHLYTFYVAPSGLLLDHGEVEQFAVLSRWCTPKAIKTEASLANGFSPPLEALSDKLGERGITGEICLFGGTVMVLAFTARLATKDVDAVFQPTQTIRELARTIAEQLNLPENWLNDGVKGYVSCST